MTGDERSQKKSQKSLVSRVFGSLGGLTEESRQILLAQPFRVTPLAELSLTVRTSIDRRGKIHRARE